MDQRLKEIVDNFDKMKIGPDEPFKFHCTQCGKCCINREDILLTPIDLFRMAKELEMRIDEFINKYCEVYLGCDSRFPIVRLVPRGSIKRCPLLKDRKCSVHRVKPTVCAMFPIGRAICHEHKKGQTPNAITADQVQYIFTNPGCGDASETHTVREWFDSFGIPMQDDYFVKWQNVLTQTSDILRKLEKIVSRETFEMVTSTIYVKLYLSYDTGKDFLPQFENSAQEILTVMQKIPLIPFDRRM